MRDILLGDFLRGAEPDEALHGEQVEVGAISAESKQAEPTYRGNHLKPAQCLSASLSS